MSRFPISKLLKRFDDDHAARYGRERWKKIRRRLLRLPWICKICWEPIKTKEELSIDHIRPLSRGGNNDISNLQLAHKKCNAEKGNKF